MCRWYVVLLPRAWTFAKGGIGVDRWKTFNITCMHVEVSKGCPAGRATPEASEPERLLHTASTPRDARVGPRRFLGGEGYKHRRWRVFCAFPPFTDHDHTTTAVPSADVE
ncbi:hypothetical protein VTO73DRAFT_322 [Trametes versicolor]